ncbi:MAG: NACHT domain-containing protein [Hassallia sp. WJT32-NPBG1]|jgi:energy-coupling factor transporter ATP-binding protein EcfA2|nr:NACHT domain-containing protein [Hassallia sp. WJT32-NPBG1]
MKNLSKNPQFIFIVGAIIASIIGYLINQLPGIPDFPHKTEILFTCVFIFTMLAALITYWQAKQQPEETPAEIDPTIRPRLLEAETTKVKKRLHDSLHNLLILDLMREEQPQQVGRKPLQTLYTVSVNNTTSQPQALDKMADLLYRSDIGGRLLILGKPGSGKTTTLLNLADELLDKAKQNDKEPIPMIFELSAWRYDSVSILDWLVLQLKQEYNLAPGISRVWFERGKILPLLDGLDELGLEKQKKCIRAINQYLAEDARLDLVVCCRDEQYFMGREQLSTLHGAVCLQELSNDQIRNYLTQLQLDNLWQSIQNNADFFHLTKTPLLLSMMVVAYQGRAIQTKEELFDAYIERRFELLPVKGGEPQRRKTMDFLVFLAKQLRRTQTEFLIEKMQPNCLQNSRQRFFYEMIFGLLYGLILSLILWLIHEILGLLSGLVYGLLVGQLLGILFFGSSIQTVEIIQFSFTVITFRKFIKFFIVWMIYGLIIGLILGINIGLNFGLGLIFGLTFGLILGLVLGLIFGLIYGLRGEIVNKSIPNQGIKASAKNMVVLTILFNFIFLLGQIWLEPFLLQFSSAIDTTIILNISQSLILVITFFLGGGIACIQHFSLRLVLWYNRYIPWNYAKFLNRASERRLIQQTGGRYRFIHRLLLEHYAKM